jgi:pSer/pThr/pTyr-binding forkhead associated (FHA) protein
MPDKITLLRFKTSSATLRGTETIIGRSIYCTVAISDPSVSRVHASISHRAGQMFIHDLGSKNGTFLNGSRVGTQPAALRVGDSVRFGDVKGFLEEADAVGRRDTSDHPALLEEPDQETVRTLVGGAGNER